MMDPKIILGRILQRFEDLNQAQVEGYNKFVRMRETNSSVIVLRENGKEAVIPFAKIIRGIEFYQEDNTCYDGGPGNLREGHITHVNSPVFALLHLLPKEIYKP